MQQERKLGVELHTRWPVEVRAHQFAQPPQSASVVQGLKHLNIAPSFSRTGVKGEEATSTVKAEVKSKAESFILGFKTETLLRSSFQ
jgi:hypothetical protein